MIYDFLEISVDKAQKLLQVNTRYKKLPLFYEKNTLKLIVSYIEN